MEIIPVLDIRRGKAVSGKSGKREKYTDLKTIFSKSSNPIEIARNLPFKRIYIADLDGIEKKNPDLNLIRKIAEKKKVILDAGIRNKRDYKEISQLNVEIVLGSETFEDAENLEDYTKGIFSLDIKNGKVLSKILPEEPYKAFKILHKKGFSRFIFLNISSVGTLKVNFDLFSRIPFNEIEAYYGGGIRENDLPILEKKGIKGALIGTALHKGLINL
jgi:phosphoribosylformimino-5-aminoimidazole carboxamide ribotide isomerase